MGLFMSGEESIILSPYERGLISGKAGERINQTHNYAFNDIDYLYGYVVGLDIRLRSRCATLEERVNRLE